MWAIDAVRQLASRDRHFERAALDVGPGVRLVRVAGVEHLFGGGAGEAGLDTGELSEWLDGSHGDLTGRDLGLQLSGQRQDP